MAEKKQIPYPDLSEKIQSAKTLTELAVVLRVIAKFVEGKESENNDNG